MIVGPAGLARGRSYGAGAIASALARYAHGERVADVRAATSPSRVVGASASERWITLVRWIDAAAAGHLFAVAGAGGHDRRRVAERVAHALAARAGHQFGDDLIARAFEGAAIAA